jgi:hypothetical protein
MIIEAPVAEIWRQATSHDFYLKNFPDYVAIKRELSTTSANGEKLLITFRAGRKLYDVQSEVKSLEVEKSRTLVTESSQNTLFLRETYEALSPMRTRVTMEGDYHFKGLAKWLSILYAIGFNRILKNRWKQYIGAFPNAAQNRVESIRIWWGPFPRLFIFIAYLAIVYAIGLLIF